MQHQKAIIHLYIIDECKTSKKNGIGTFIGQLISLLKSGNIKIHVIQFNAEVKHFCKLQKNGIEYLKFPYYPIGGIIGQIKILSRFLRLYIIDRDCNYFIINHFPLVELMRILKKYFKRSRLVYIIHDLSWTTPLRGNLELFKSYIANEKRGKERNRVLRFKKDEEIMMRLADKVVCLSQDTKNILVDYYSVCSEKIHLIHNALKNSNNSLDSNKRILKRTYGIPENEQILLYVGRTSEAKGFFALLKAFELVCLNINNVRLVIAGNANDFDWSPYLSVMTKITYLGHVDKNTLFKVYQMADIGVIPSYTEQCSYVGLEMMSYKIPIVASNGLGVRNMFKNEKNAITATIDFSDIELYANNIAKAILKLLNDFELRTNLQIEGEKTLNTLYNVDVMKDLYISLFK